MRAILSYQGFPSLRSYLGAYQIHSLLLTRWDWLLMSVSA